MRALLLALACVAAVPARADDIGEARRRFVEGTDFVKRAQWSEALAAFEQSSKLHPHAVTTFNMAACQRAMGRYTVARSLFRRALDENTSQAGKLPESLVEEARALLAETDRLLARVWVTIDPPDATLAVDGRPLARVESEAEPGANPKAPADAPPLLVAGTRAPGVGEAPPAGGFGLLIDPGPHVFLLARKGYTDVVVNKSFAPGTRGTLALQLDRLPATLHVGASHPGAVVTVDGVDVGAAPVDVQRPAGSYKVIVQKKGFQNYQASVTVRAGEEATLRATLEEKKVPVYKKWWFWTAAAVVLAGVGVGTYFAAREPPRLDGGGLQWTIEAR